MSQTVNSDGKVSELLLELKRHLTQCRDCQGAIKVRDRSAMCDHTIGLIISIAQRYDTVIPRRLKVRRGGDKHVFPCPDLSAHGKTYPLIAEPMIVVGVEMPMF